MKGDRGAAEPARLALLCLLLDAPSYGYDLARRFEPSSALGDIVRLSASHLYALLTRLERDGSIAGERQDAGARPQRRVYHLTEAGRFIAVEWLSAPVDHPRDMRIEFPLKLYLARARDETLATDLVRAQRRRFVEYIAYLEGEATDTPGKFDAAYIDLTRRGRIGRARAALDWLDASEPVLARFAGEPVARDGIRL